MTPAAERSITLRVATVDQLFNAPDANPFSANDEDVLGEAALERVVRRLQVHPLREWANAELIITLPPDQITPDLEPRLTEALHRYCTARIEDNRTDVHLSRVQHTVGLIAVSIITLIVMAVAYFLLQSVLSDSPSVVQGMIVAAVSVFAWVIMWDPLEALLFDWANPARENRTLRHIMEMKVVVQPQT